MPDDPKVVGPLDQKLIALSEPYEVAYWTKELACTEPELTEAVRAMGSHSVADVRDYFLHLREGSEGSAGENGVGEE